MSQSGGPWRSSCIVPRVFAMHAATLGLSYGFHVVLLLALLPAAVSAQEVFVGPAADPGCDYQSVQEAIDDWIASPESGHLTVYIDNTQAYAAQALTVTTPAAGTSIALRGDRAGCGGAFTAERAALDGVGGAAAPVIDILGDVAGEDRRFEVQLHGLQVSGGDHAAGDGGGVRVRGNVVLSVFETTLRDNVAQNGGGVAIEAIAAGAPHLILFGNRRPGEITGNTAGDGGGILCRDATVYCDRYCLIADNSASGNGGGIAQDNCVTSLYVPNSSPPFDPGVGLRGNSADGDGGAVWASGGEFAMGSGFQRPSSPMTGNVAGGDGGGIFLTGQARLTAANMQFDDNHAGGNGGAVAADNASSLAFNPATSVGGGCAADVERCARMRNNSALLAGGAIHLRDSGFLTMSDHVLQGNRAPRASAIGLENSTGATLTNTLASGNGGGSELILSDNGYVELRYVTIAGNGADDSALLRFDAPVSFGMSNSILHDGNGGDSGVVLDAAAGSTISSSCSIVHETASLAGHAGVVTTSATDPLWDTSGRYPAWMYAPGRHSPAIDACGFGTGAIPDLLGTARAVDDPRPDLAGPYDMGAVEFVARPEVFADGFEMLD